ncbi:hypothetical protein A5816_002910 [Enterococcus sp. 3G1_DIV0629]|uniref:hypothetical protein n=1 Tax=Enterococcus sp. (strain 3G1_DIV0629) TaxID=1834176 RepID=UPI000A35398E|nr:hypothetical protein [Enterococcus sp. 3G1_DIV0629]OTO22238.1 hypothetical protein A5816_002910 [Enterococcus sp. 3G1_DIV0629]
MEKEKLELRFGYKIEDWKRIQDMLMSIFVGIGLGIATGVLGCSVGEFAGEELKRPIQIFRKDVVENVISDSVVMIINSSDN